MLIWYEIHFMLVFSFIRLTDALSMAHDESLPPEYGANKTAELMVKTLRWKLEKCFCETVSKSPKGILHLF